MSQMNTSLQQAQQLLSQGKSSLLVRFVNDECHADGISGGISYLDYRKAEEPGPHFMAAHVANPGLWADEDFVGLPV